MPSAPSRSTIDHPRSPAARRVALRRGGATPAPTPALDGDALVDIAVGLARAEGLWRAHVSHDPLSRTSVRLVATEAYEVWLLGWTRGQRVEFHDHGGANAAFVVLEGRLQEFTLGVAGTTTRRLASGDVGVVPSGTIHDVINPHEPVATSLHVYSNPLQSMTFYGDDGQPSYTELVQIVPAIISAERQSRALHPSGGRP